ncbi:MAG: hypothetical protein GY822_22345 [Deltaproteobacteria bacterium]|nr:hypothetical protein [Deltaproteobacteria bacterium]
MKPKGPNDNDSDEIICHCGQVSRGVLVEAIRNGKTSLRLLRDELGAAVACRGCVEDIENLLKTEGQVKRENKPIHPDQKDFFLPDSEEPR